MTDPTPIVSDEEIQAFEEDKDYEIPATRADVTEDKPEATDKGDDKDAPKADEDKGDAPADDDKDTNTDDDKDDVEPTPAPELAVTVEDPGEFVPNDYSFEAITYDEDGKNAKVNKIESVEEWDKLLAEDPNFGSGAALLKAERQANKMSSNLERDKTKHEEKKAQFEAQKQEADNRLAAAQTMESEIEYLTNEKLLPPVDAKFKDADWSDKEVAKQPGVKERISLLNHMRDENNRRAKNGLRPVSSVIDAYSSWKLADSAKQGADAKIAAGNARKAAGARVASGSPSAMNSVPAGLSVGRGGSLDDL